jgi:hypothetical protein
MALIAAHLGQLLNEVSHQLEVAHQLELAQNEVTQNNVTQNNVTLTTSLYTFQNVLHVLYYDERYILPVGILVKVPEFNEPFIYFSEDYPHTHTRSLNHYVENNNEVNHRRTLLNYTNIAKNTFMSIINEL